MGFMSGFQIELWQATVLSLLLGASLRVVPIA